MKRLPVVLSENAISDIEAIIEHIAIQNGGMWIAEAFAKRIEARCAKIGDVPRGGRARDDLIAGMRTVPFEHSAVIAYIVEADHVLIANIFYGGRDFEAMLRDDETG